MSVAIVTGSAGLIGSEAAEYFAGQGHDVVGIDNDLRQHFFGKDASTQWRRHELEQQLGDRYAHREADIRNAAAMQAIFAEFGRAITLVVHTAAQPSHDWAIRDPAMDFGVNAVGTLNLLEATRKHCPDAVFIFTSTNKVYGDRPNSLPLRENPTRWELPSDHDYYPGVPEEMSIDQSMHSVFGASKVAADIMVQEYGRYCDLKTVCFRGGCLTGPNHSGAQLHGFLAYLMKCTVTGTPYTVFGYRGKQVRDNIHSADLIGAFDEFYRNPRPGEVYNIGGGRMSNCSMLEAIDLCENIAQRPLSWTLSDDNRAGDHIWWISDTRKFQQHYPSWQQEYDVPRVLREIYEANVDKWTAGKLTPAGTT